MSTEICYNREIMTNILFISWIALILYVLLETDAPVKYAEFFGLKVVKYKEFKEKKDMFPDLKYKNFLSTYYGNFLVYLLTCQECLCVWLNIIGFLIFPHWLHGWAFFGITTIGSLFLIALFNFILRKLYE